jgi:hypothetical protein
MRKDCILEAGIVPKNNRRGKGWVGLMCRVSMCSLYIAFFNNNYNG